MGLIVINILRKYSFKAILEEKNAGKQVDCWTGACSLIRSLNKPKGFRIVRHINCKSLVKIRCAFLSMFTFCFLFVC